MTPLPPDDTPPTANLERNDVEGALAVVRWYRERGRCVPHETGHALIMLQDDGEGFLEKLSEINRQYPLPRLVVRCGQADGIAFRVKFPGALENFRSPKPGIQEGALAGWQRVGVIFTSRAGKSQFFVLESGGEDNEVRHGPFFVRGRFTVVERFNNLKKAVEAWKGFEAT